MKVGICYYGINTESESLLDKVVAYIKNKLEKEMEIITFDLSRVEAQALDVALFFGGTVKAYQSKEIKTRQFTVASLGEMLIDEDLKSSALETINEMIEFLNKEVTTVVAVETNGISIGEKNTDILITKEEALHLGHIIKLLGPNPYKVKISKGDINLEIDYK